MVANGRLYLCCGCWLWWTAAVVLSEAQLLISPPSNSDSANRYVVKNGSKFTISCVYEDDGQKPQSLKWTNGQDVVIDGESSASVFTLGLRESQTRNHKRLLVFKTIQQRDAGVYKCKANTQQATDLMADIEIVVVEPSSWVDKRTTVGAMVGEAVIINCGATGVPEPNIAITDGKGANLDDSRFVTAGTEVSIGSVKMEDQKTVVQCVSSQVFSQHGYTNVETRQVAIDVMYAPKFAENEINRYGILNRNGSLICNVSESNPKTTEFHFLKDGQELIDPVLYKVQVNLTTQQAVLHINKVKAEDFGVYTCKVGNGKAFSSMSINFMEAFPPSGVRTSLEAAHTDSIVWKVFESAEEPSALPISHIRVSYVRKELIDHVTGRDFEEMADAREQVWLTQGRLLHLKKASDDLYPISGLRPAAAYVFRFRAVSEAGWGEEMELTASTVSVNPPEPITDSAPGRHALVWTTALVMLTRILC